MNFFLYVIVVLGIVVGGGSTLLILGTMFGTLIFKLYRKIKYGISLYD